MDECVATCRVVSALCPTIAVRRPVDEPIARCRVVSSAWAAIAIRYPGNRSPSRSGAWSTVRGAPIVHPSALRIVVLMIEQHGLGQPTQAPGQPAPGRVAEGRHRDPQPITYGR